MRKFVLHFHDQSEVAKNLVRFGRKLGHSWYRIPRYPEYKNFYQIKYFYGVSSEIIARGLAGASNAFLHIHGGHLTAMLRRTKLPYVLHIHGSEVRNFTKTGQTTFDCNNETARAIEKALFVFYSTPDLKPFVEELRQDSIWLPNLLSEKIFQINKNTSSHKREFTFDIFWPHSWSNSKGAFQFMELISQIESRLGRKLKVAGIKFGEYQEMAMRAGFHLFPPASRPVFWRYNNVARLTVGQATGIIAVSDLEAMVASNAFFPFPLEKYTQETYFQLSGYVGPEDINAMLENILIFLESGATSSQDLKSILSVHDYKYVIPLLADSYSKLELK